MKKIPVENAIGEAICHDMTAIMADGFKGVRFKRGHVITPEDIPILLDMGKAQVFVWEPEADEVHEEDAARELSEVICGDNIGISGPKEGKYQISSKIDGLFCVNGEALKKINMVDDYTVACRPGNTRISEDDALAGLRIIPLVTKRSNVEKAVAAAKENYPVFSVLPFKKLKTSIIITGSEVYTGRIRDRFEPVLREKLSSYEAEILSVTKCMDNPDMLLDAVNAAIANGAELIFMTGGMSVDPDDLTPTAIRMTGAKVAVQGVPLQPGNMLTVAYLNRTTIVGVPGASLNAPMTSLDVFLPRILAGVELTKEDAAGMGEGGFCLWCKECTYSKCYFGK